MNDHLDTIMEGTSANAVDRLLEILYPDAGTVLDPTYGNGGFWKRSARVRVIGMDRDPRRTPDFVADFCGLPCASGSVEVVIFDLPFHTDMGRGKASVMRSRFGTFGTIPELQAAVTQGCQEAWRAARLGVIVKVQDYIHASRPVWMSDWVKAAMPVEPYDFLMLRRPHKMTDPKWTRQLSVWRNHATFWVFRKDGNVHRARPRSGASIWRDGPSRADHPQRTHGRAQRA